MIFWLCFVIKPDYPATKLNLAISIVKLFADSMAFLTYHSYGHIILFLSVVLVVLDFLIFLVVYRKCKLFTTI